MPLNARTKVSRWNALHLNIKQPTLTIFDFMTASVKLLSGNCYALGIIVCKSSGCPALLVQSKYHGINGVSVIVYWWWGQSYSNDALRFRDLVVIFFSNDLRKTPIACPSWLDIGVFLEFEVWRQVPRYVDMIFWGYLYFIKTTNYLSIHKLQLQDRWSLGVDK